jgi:signal transduction histidine kinase
MTYRLDSAPASELARRLGDAPRSERPALRISVVYAVVAGVWIFLSDAVVGWLARGEGESLKWQTAKGLAYVVATSALLYALVTRYVGGLRRAREQLRAIVEGMPDAVLVATPDGVVRHVNRAAVTLFGAVSAEALLAEPGGPRARLGSSRGRPLGPGDDPLVRALSGSPVAAAELCLRRDDGVDVWVSATAAPVLDGERVCMAIAVLRDIRDLRRAEALRERFLAAAAHELKTPLACIKGYVQLLDRWSAASRPEREVAAYRVIGRQVDRMTRLVQALLDADPVQLGQLELRRERVDVTDLLEEAVEQMRPLAPRRRLVLEVGEPAPVLGDRDRLDAVLRNLLDNAVRFSRDDGTVTARVRVASGEAVVSVQDRGVGVPPDRRGDLFEPFCRTHVGATDQDKQGIGISLHVSRAIVERHGGRIWFESEEGRGATFHVALPLAGPGAP